MASGTLEITCLVRLLTKLRVPDLKPITLLCDNQSSIYIAKNHVFHERTNHINIDCYFTRGKALEGLLQLSYLPTNKHQLADVFTKALSSSKFNTILSKLGMLLSDFSLRGNVELCSISSNTGESN